MTFKDASNFVMPFGKFKGRTLDAIASTDSGLKYLDWLRGERAYDNSCKPIDHALDAYMSDDTIKRELERIT